MFIPEFTITPKILKNIGSAEYCKAIIETTTILPAWEAQFKKEVLSKNIYANVQLTGLSTNYETVKRYVDGLSANVPQEVVNLKEAYNSTKEISKNKELEELSIKFIHQNITDNLIPKGKRGVYRNKNILNKIDADEVLAYITEAFDWINSLDAKENHPLIIAAILKGVFELIEPFEHYNDAVAEIACATYLEISNYDFRGFISLPSYYLRLQNEYEHNISSLTGKYPDFTRWIEFFTEAVAYETLSIKEKVKLIEKDTKIAKASGRAKLSQRQEKIVEYLQDYVMLQNKDFERVFPSISEDTVLRDLKVLIDMGIVVKRGSTKSSRYELK